MWYLVSGGDRVGLPKQMAAKYARLTEQNRKIGCHLVKGHRQKDTVMRDSKVHVVLSNYSTWGHFQLNGPQHRGKKFQYYVKTSSFCLSWTLHCWFLSVNIPCSVVFWGVCFFRPSFGNECASWRERGKNNQASLSLLPFNALFPVCINRDYPPGAQFCWIWKKHVWGFCLFL